MQDNIILKRLAFIKYLYHKAKQESYEREPYNTSSVLAFHDAVELFLYIAWEKMGGTGTEPSFMGYWSQLNPILKDKGKPEITQQSSMKKLKDMRKELKHRGTFPSNIEIEAIRVHVNEFFEENTPTVFDINFEDITLANMLSNAAAKEALAKAESCFRANSHQEAIQSLALAYHYLEERIYKYFNMSFFSPHHHRDIDYSNIRGDLQMLESKLDSKIRDLDRFLEGVAEGINATKEPLRSLIVGIDPRKHVRFRQLISKPHWKPRGDGPHFNIHEGCALSEHEFNFCFNFIIEVDMGLRDLDD